MRGSNAPGSLKPPSNDPLNMGALNVPLGLLWMTRGTPIAGVPPLGSLKASTAAYEGVNDAFEGEPEGARRG